MNPSINTVLNAIDKSLAERDGNVDRFCSHLDKDIADLAKEVKEIKQEVQNPMILDANADKLIVKKKLDQLQMTMEELQKRAFQYKAYQKNFKVEVTKYEELEEVHSELRLKQLLWDSIDEWDKMVAEWMEVCFWVFFTFPFN